MQINVKYKVMRKKYAALHYVYLKTKTRNYYVNNRNRFLMLRENRLRKRREERADALRQGAARENERGKNETEKERAKCRKKIRQCEKSKVKRRFILLYA